ncbi:MAG: hypothetical protein D6798_03355 [Deltaproteobacteria bacterium]|nr:MAG: hypothetical protein D6798_03355 [Deltaproteobacteria bacterium]
MTRLLLPPLLLSLSLAAACEPTCKAACDKLVSCEEIDSPRQAVIDCQTSCEIQQNLYETWQDHQARDAMADLKHCIVSEECAAIDEGVCYDADLYIW